MTGSYVFDANAVLDFVEAGPGIHKVDQLLHAAARRQVTVLVSVMNLGEVFYWLWQKSSEEQARQTLDGLTRLPIQIVPVDLPQVLRAGELKALHTMWIASPPLLLCSIAPLSLPPTATSRNSGAIFRSYGSHVHELPTA